jgi:hypothetical protein
MLSKPLHPIGLQNEFIQVRSDKKGEEAAQGGAGSQKGVSNVNTDLTRTPALNLGVLKKDDLRKIAKDNKLYITGNKTMLIQRIEDHKRKIQSASVIQCIFRGYLVRHSFQLRGPGFCHIDRCNNQTDFYTLEPLSEIGVRDFYSYADTNNFVYGFNVNSLMELLKTRGNMVNPYNREEIPPSVLAEIRVLYRVIQVVFPDMTMATAVPPRRRSNSYHIVDLDRSQTTQSYLPFSLQTNRLMGLVDYNNMVNRIREIRRKPANQRMVDLFIEVDLLGNYTQSVWFTGLSRIEYLRLYRAMYDLWSYRANLSSGVKNRICPLGSPFHGLFTEPTYNQDISLERIQNACLCVFENMVYTGVDEEHRKLGALHCLTGLTVVCLAARMSIPWLYESIQL